MIARVEIGALFGSDSEAKEEEQATTKSGAIWIGTFSRHLHKNANPLSYLLPFI